MENSPRAPNFASMPNFRKGFFFTVLALIVLTFMSASVQMWAQEQQLRESRAAERFRLDAMRSALSLVDENVLEEFSNASLLYSMHFLSKKLGDTPCSPPFVEYNEGGGNFPSYPDGTYYVARALAELMENGTTHAASPVNFGPFYCPQHSSSWNATYDSNEMRYTLQHFFNKTSTAAKLFGYNLTWGKVHNLTVNQSAIWIVSASFDVNATLTDNLGFTQTKELHVISGTEINGLLDPFVAGMDRAHRGVGAGVSAKRQVFYVQNYTVRADAQAKVAKNGSEGLGFFFGPVVEKVHGDPLWTLSSVTYNLSRMSSYIFKTNSPALAMSESDYFGGIILTATSGYSQIGTRTVGSGCQLTTYTQTNCVYCHIYEIITGGSGIQCSGVTPNPGYINDSTKLSNPVPYVMASSMPSIQNNYHLGLPEALISNKYNFSEAFGTGTPCWNCAEITRKFSAVQGDSAIVDLTGPRDMAICGYYVPSINGPSYLKRFTNPNYWGNTPYSYIAGSGGSLGTSIGIESVLLGTWAGGKDDPHNLNNVNIVSQSSEFYSRLDYQFYKPYIGWSSDKCIGLFMKGMSGCKDYAMCAPSSEGPALNATGRFAFDNSTASWYGFSSLLSMPPKSGQVPSSCD